jgi:hypothetical protein
MNLDCFDCAALLFEQLKNVRFDCRFDRNDQNSGYCQKANR